MLQLAHITSAPDQSIPPVYVRSRSLRSELGRLIRKGDQKACPRRHLSDACAHLPSAQHGNALNRGGIGAHGQRCPGAEW